MRAAWALLAIAGRVAAAAPALSPRTLSYTMDLRLDPAAHVVRGHELIRWKNQTHVAADRICLHLYLNAFRSEQSTFLRERRESGLPALPEVLGGIDVSQVKVDGAPAPLLPRGDGTIAEVELAAPAPPGGEVTLDLDFQALLPRIFARAGYAGPFHLLAEMYPKPGVFSDAGWSCHEFHANAEFYADFASYDVSLTLPAHYVVGATGVEVGAPEPAGAGLLRHHFHADDVHELAIAADPRFRRAHSREDGVDIEVLYTPDREPLVGRQLEAARRCLRWYGGHILPYPYPRLTVVDAPSDADQTGSMEYPMLVTLAERSWPAGSFDPEIVTMHECGHQWWYGIVASNEVDEAWLDEGVNEYVTGLAMDDWLGPSRSLFDVDLGIVGGALGIGGRLAMGYGGGHALWNRLAPEREPIAQASFAYAQSFDYGAANYDKTALALDTLESAAGREAMLGAFRGYARAHAFAHPTWLDLRAALGALPARGVDAFLATAFERDGVMDYAVSEVVSEPARLPRSMSPLAGSPAEREPGDALPDPAGGFASRVLVRRLGAVVFPVELELLLEGGQRLTLPEWDGAAAWHRFELRTPRPIERAWLAPRPLDADAANDAMTRAASLAPALRAAAGAQTVVQLLLQLVGL